MTSDSKTTASAWQPLFAASAIFVVAAVHLMTALTFLFSMGDWQGLKTNVADWQSIFDGLANATPEEVYEWLLSSAYIFTIVGVVLLLLGILIWRGVSRHGVRLTATITLVISWLGALRMELSPDGGGAGSGIAANALIFASVTAGLIGVITLWFGGGARGVRAHISDS